ncbi:hypothetical protein [Hyphococcus luteus]|nr:hypothetical protein [Marinicaulis flavus]
MDRRLFVKTAVSSVAASQTVLPAAASFLRTGAPDRIFYDARFSEALKMAGALAGQGRLTPVASDVTALWRGDLASLSRAAPLTLKGVTTESFYFCLKTLLQAQGPLESNIERVSKDLYAWSVRTGAARKTG